MSKENKEPLGDGHKTGGIGQSSHQMVVTSSHFEASGPTILRRP
jgi:hypothetical protein